MLWKQGACSNRHMCQSLYDKAKVYRELKPDPPEAEEATPSKCYNTILMKYDPPEQYIVASEGERTTINEVSLKIKLSKSKFRQRLIVMNG